MTIRRTLGEASTTHERNLEQAVGRVPSWRGKHASYTSLVGGLMNQNWLVEITGDTRRYFVKVPGEGSEMFIDRVVANEAARNAHAAGIGPEVIFFDGQDGLEVSEFLEGYRACTNGDFGDPSIQSDVLGLYRRLHDGPKLGVTKTIFDMIEEHVEQGRELGSHFPLDMPWIMHRYRQAKAAFMASGLDLVPCFNDPMPGNFLISADSSSPPKPMRLIDYEFASNNERSYELGVLFAEMFFDEPLSLRLTEQYLGSASPQMAARMTINRALADIKWACWAVVNRKLKDWDFDYQKYGVWKYMRARDVMYDPRWESWLRMV
jgi:thiamine kinase-like enzyme